MTTTLPRSGPAAPRAPASAVLRLPRRGWVGLGAAFLALGLLSLLLPATLSYDPWSWVGWGRGVLELDLDTRGGPSWKPLPVLVTTPLAVFGDAAPDLWLAIARAGGLLALFMAFRLASRLAGGGPAGALAGVIAAVGVALSLEFFRSMGLGTSEPWLIALTLVAIDRHLDGRFRQALVFGYLVGLLRPEAWALLFLYALWVVWRDRSSWKLVFVLGVLMPILWFVPEWWGSGEPFRGAQHAKRPDDTTYGIYAHPARAAADDAAKSLLPPVLVGVGIALLAGVARLGRGRHRRDLLVLTAGAAVWIAIVLVMIARGYAGSSRYFMGAAGVLAVVGGTGWGIALSWSRDLLRSQPRAATLVATTIGLLALALLVPYGRGELSELRDQAEDIRGSARTSDALPVIVDRAGGRDRILGCATPRTEHLAAPMVAWYLDVPRVRVAVQPRPAGYVLQLRGRRTGVFRPKPPRGASFVASHERWRVLETGCRRGGV